MPIPIPYFVWPSDVRDEFARCDAAMWRLYNEINERAQGGKLGSFDGVGYLAWFQTWREYYAENHDSWIAINAQTVAVHDRIMRYEAELKEWRQRAADARLAPADDPIVPKTPPAVSFDDVGTGTKLMGLGILAVAGMVAYGYAARR